MPGLGDYKKPIHSDLDEYLLRQIEYSQDNTELAKNIIDKQSKIIAKLNDRVLRQEETISFLNKIIFVELVLIVFIAIVTF